MPSTSRIRGYVTGASIAAACAAIAFSAPAANAAWSSDARATAYDGNVTTCAEAGLSGDIISVSSSGGVENVDQYVDVTGVPEGYVLTGVVVKGGPGYNVYEGLGALPWEDLRAPLTKSGQLPAISHWFACGEQDYGYGDS